jgi:hypothetical protein
LSEAPSRQSQSKQVSLRTGLADEWLQAALALSIAVFLGKDPLDPSSLVKGPAVSTDRSGGREASYVAVHLLGIEGRMATPAAHPRRRTEAAEARNPPDDAVEDAFRRSRPADDV